MSTLDIDFARLSLRDALDLAVLIEEEAQERYDEFAHQMEIHHTPEAAAFFRFMADNEAKHGARLAQRRAELFGDAPRTVTRAMLWDVEAPEYDQARAFMTARRAMQAALRSEEKAHAFFVDALPQVSDPGVVALFNQLRAEEIEHQDLVKRELAKLGAEPEVNDDDFVDEPTAQ
ncbi:MAG TPA: ferritin family protein [Candidatus Kryptonia bacterium]|nr:ferritin family protein [Candidatus Kryptonia bacterium]